MASTAPVVTSVLRRVGQVTRVASERTSLKYCTRLKRVAGLEEGFGAFFEDPPVEGEDCCDPCLGVVTDTVILIFM